MLRAQKQFIVAGTFEDVVVTEISAKDRDHFVPFLVSRNRDFLFGNPARADSRAANFPPYARAGHRE
jgi:hypothetical protein